MDKYYFQNTNKKYLLYATKANCKDIDQYPNLKKHLEKFKEIMEARRETKKGTIKWWQMHWPRKKILFENEKIDFRSVFIPLI